MEQEAQEGESARVLPSGIAQFDETRNGFEPGSLVVVQANISVGKTALATNIALNVAVDQGEPVLFFSSEMSYHILAMNMNSILASTDFWSQKEQGTFPEQIKPLWDEAAEQLKDAPLWIDDTPRTFVEDIRSRATAHAEQRGLALVVADFVQILRTRRTVSGGNETLRLKHIAYSLKGLARELDLVVLVLSQTTEKDDGQRTTRWGEEIEEAADWVFSLVRADDAYDGGESYREPDVADRDLYIDKARIKGTGCIPLSFNQPILTFSRRAVGD